MGVTASMSVSIVVEEQLWGLVACHHYSGPHRPSQDARAAAEFLGQVASQVVVERERSDAREAALATQADRGRHDRPGLGDDGPAPADPDRTTPTCSRCSDAHGAALCYDGVLTTRGAVPDEPTLRRIAAALESPLQLRDPDRPRRRPGPGAGGRPRGRRRAADRVGAGPLAAVAARPSRSSSSTGAATPRTSCSPPTEGPEVRLSPRKSFEKWRQVVRGRSLPWTSWQVDAADTLGKHMIGVLLQPLARADRDGRVAAAQRRARPGAASSRASTSPPATSPPRPTSSAATGGTPSSCPTVGSRSRSATSPATASRPRRR